jgi:hypothetical protein
MKKSSLFFVLLNLIWISSCVIAVVDSRSQQGGWLPQGEFHKTLDFKPGGTFSLDNANGAIEISGWDDEKIEISAQEKIRYPASSGIHFAGWRSFKPDIHLLSSENRLRIETRDEDSKESDREINYIFQVPRSIRLDSIRNGRGNILISGVFGSARLDAEEGEIKIKNYSGTLDVRLGNGRVEAELLDVRPQDDLRIKIDQGDIVVYLEPAVDARIEASSPEGNITSDIDLKQPLPAKQVAVELGDGKATIRLTALSGDITIRKVEE